MATINQECLNKYVTKFACKISTLATKYYDSLLIGSTCSENYLFQIELATALLDQICGIDLDTEGCLSKNDICNIIDKLKYILDRNKCGCCND